MNIAIVENEQKHRDYLESLLDTWSVKESYSVKIQYFISAEMLIEHSDTRFDLMFMDVELGGMDGVLAARKLRELGFEGELVFLTSFSEYVFQGYGVKALNYLLKPPTSDQIEACMDYVRRKLAQEKYTFRYRRTVHQVPLLDILYFTSAGHYVEIVTRKERLQQIETLGKVYGFLPKEFLFCHRTTIVNVHHIQMLKGQDLVLTDNIVLPVGPKYLQEVRLALLEEAARMR